jgi:hypothetical protein
MMVASMVVQLVYLLAEMWAAHSVVMRVDYLVVC